MTVVIEKVNQVNVLSDRVKRRKEELLKAVPRVCPETTELIQWRVNGSNIDLREIIPEKDS